jgi:hypothetical protein
MIVDCAHYREGRRQHEGPRAAVEQQHPDPAAPDHARGLGRSRGGAII